MSQYQPHLDWLETKHQDMCDLTVTWANINSGTCHIEGLAKMSQALQATLRSLGGELNDISLPPYEEINDLGQCIQHPVGNALRVIKRPEAPLQVLFCGHMDTVFPADSSFQVVTKIDDNTLNGPGVSDMKGGLVVMMHALMALEKSPLAKNIGWEILINPDEEIGSLSSAPLIAASAKGKDFALIFEPAMTPRGTLASERKGAGKFSIVVTGKAAHAGRAFHEGLNAIVKISSLIKNIDKLNGQREGVTLNVGRISGGGQLNVVPDLAVCFVDVRIVQHEDKAWVMQHLEQLVSETNDAIGFSATLHGKFNREPKILDQKTQHLHQVVIDTAKELGVTLDMKPSGGCCDGNNLSAAGVPVVDSLGVHGGDIHSDKEYILLHSLVERAQITALLLMKFAAGEVSL